MSDIEKKIILRKAKTHKGRVHISNTLPKMNEDPKICLFFNTSNSSELMRIALNEIFLTRKSFSLKMNKKNQLGCPFENHDSIEHLSLKNNACLFTFTSDTKKRPLNLAFGRLFNHKILDMFEFEVTNFIPQESFEATTIFSPNSQPIMIFSGEQFETNKVLERFKFYLMDFYKQDAISEVNITDLKRIIVFSIDENETIKIRHYQCKNISEYSLDKLNLEEVGPSFDLKSRRNEIASEDIYKLACKQPKLLNKENKIKINSLLDVKAKIYTSRQNLDAASLKRYDRILGKKRKTTQHLNKSE